MLRDVGVVPIWKSGTGAAEIDRVTVFVWEMLPESADTKSGNVPVSAVG